MRSRPIKNSASDSAPVLTNCHHQRLPPQLPMARWPYLSKRKHPRRLLVLPNGDIIVAEQKPGHLTLLRGKEGNGKAEFIERYAEGFNQPYGLAWREDHILVADQDGIWKIPHVLGNLRTGH